MDTIKQIEKIIHNSQRIVIIQADNPDADSLASALALEQILHVLGKEPLLYCGIDMPDYLKYLQGWDRVSNEIPTQFDATIIVDTSAMSLLDQLSQSVAKNWVAAKPCIVLDHHQESAEDIPFTTVLLNDYTKASTGELIYSVSKQLNWVVNTVAAQYIMTSILADTMGLVTENTTPSTYRVMAELIETGVNRTALEEERRAYSKMSREILLYKATLITKTEFLLDNQLALVTIPQADINTYSPLYNPSALIQPDHLQTSGVRLSIVLKQYDNGRITGALRASYGTPVAGRIAEAMGGGGHEYAAGFKIEDTDLEVVKTKCLDLAHRFFEEIA
jgi:phosphoesterase RecJ-like protein